MSACERVFPANAGLLVTGWQMPDGHLWAKDYFNYWFNVYCFPLACPINHNRIYVVVALGQLIALVNSCHQLSGNLEYESTSTETVSGANNTERSLEPLPKNQRTAALSLFSYQRRPLATSASTLPDSTPETQLRKYIMTINDDSFDASENDNLFSRKEYCLLRPTFSRLFSIPATSAPVERIFSQGGIIMRPHRARMSDELLETLMMLRCNIDIDKS